ncbi:neuromedin U [Flammeovirga agarivorans]|uniref:Neuromedin U n=1 Tax=Flammeovirga agarivorans TaxID=2726742 RepID=A0A7X8SJY5_9BACT|nr:neuromedin U [Flammeovirga agarivorans]NLR91635.1 neuromedin U [Flammeovirga agarivorans]
MKKIINLLLLSIISTFAFGQDDSAEELSQQAANPIADLMSFPFQNNYNLNQGSHDRNVNVLNIQPVIPFANGKIVTRTIIPVVNVPDFQSESGKMTSGLSDIVFSAFYVPKSKNVIWGFGPVAELPTGGSTRGTEKWSFGPSFLALIQPGEWTFGFLANNVWSVAGNSERDDVNHMLLNLFIVRQLGKGWYVNSAPIITADWTAESDNQWIVPVGGGGGKLFFLGGKLPVNLQTQLYYNAIRPDFSAEWQWRVQAQILLPKSIFSRK